MEKISMKTPHKICSYIMTHDSGLAPNPFHDVCTLAVCTPNHMRANLKVNDWIVGISSKGIRKELGNIDEWKIIYAMEISDLNSLNDYYNNPNYKKKVPALTGSPIKRCGDNFYKKNSNGKLQHTLETSDHNDGDDEGVTKQDTRGNRVFIGNTYWYFGKEAVTIPRSSGWGEKLVRKFARCSVGLRYIYQGNSALNEDCWTFDDLNNFRNFLREYPNGQSGLPLHFKYTEDTSTCKSSCNK